MPKSRKKTVIEATLCNTSLFGREQLLEMQPRKIAALYQDLKQEQIKQPIDQQWNYGTQLKILKSAYEVATEPKPTK